MTLPAAATIVEVGPRDGLQNEDAVLGTDTKVELIRRCLDAGVGRIETASFVNPALVPQMADAEAVMELLGPSDPDVSYIGLVLNERGLQRALHTTVDEVNFVIGATESFNRANAGVSRDETMSAIERMLPQAGAAGRSTSVTISVAFGGPYEGEVSLQTVVELAGRAAEAGAEEIALGDTIGVAVPTDVLARLDAVGQAAPDVELRCHFHDTRNTAIGNVFAALQAGVTIIDASVGGAGGCPFAPNATGNVATEDVQYLLQRMSIESGVDGAAMAATARWLGRQLGRDLPSALARAGGFP